MFTTLFFACAMDDSIDPDALVSETAPAESEDTAGASDDTAGASEEDSPAFATVYSLLLAECEGCHSGESNATVFMMPGDPAATYDRLLTGESSYDGELRFVVPGDPEASFLLEKLEEDPQYGARMPIAFSDATLDPEDIDMVREWIAAGAKGP